MYRFESSYVLMIILYGFRPFLKGIVHAFFFDDWALQLWFLAGIELLIMGVVIGF